MSAGFATRLRWRAFQFWQQVVLNAGRRNLVADKFLDVRQRHNVVFAAEADCVTFGASAGGAADAVHVVLNVLRQVEIEYVTDVFDVQAARGNVGADQYGQLAALKIMQHALALALRDIAGDCRGVYTVR